MKRRPLTEENTPPTRLCLCQHTFHVHRRGFCAICERQDKVCAEFREDRRVPKLLIELPYLSPDWTDAHRHRSKTA